MKGPVMMSITDDPATTWNEDEIVNLKANYPDLQGTLNDAVTKYNPTPGADRKQSSQQCLQSRACSDLNSCCFSHGAGTGRTGFITVPPNNYPFYNDDEKYVPIMQADGGQLSGKS